MSSSDVRAQSWPTAQQGALWLSGSIEQPVTKATTFSIDASWRRLAHGLAPQQFVVRPGVQYQWLPGIRLGAGYAYSATQPAGLLAASAPQREHRSWQQIVLSHKTGVLSLTHRYRLEQRWSHALLAAAEGDGRVAGPAGYQNRLRYMSRAQGGFLGMQYHGRPVTAHGWAELLATLGGPSQSLTVTQDRLGAGVTVPLTGQLRLEASYLRQHNIMASRKANEVNQTMVLAWSWTGTSRK